MENKSLTGKSDDPSRRYRLSKRDPPYWWRSLHPSWPEAHIASRLRHVRFWRTAQSRRSTSAMIDPPCC